jgi:hypothetical protein
MSLFEELKRRDRVGVIVCVSAQQLYVTTFGA